jgi:hypothetical protein
VLILIHLVQVLLLLLLVLFTVALVMGIGASSGGPIETLVLLALIAGCLLLAAKIPSWAARAREWLQRPSPRS